MKNGKCLIDVQLALYLNRMIAARRRETLARESGQADLQEQAAVEINELLDALVKYDSQL